MLYVPSGLSAETARAFAQATAARNLQLLNAIESTIFRVESDTRLMEVIADGLNDDLRLLQNANAMYALDPTGVVCQNLGRAADIASGLYADVRSRHQSASEDFRLTSEDGVADVYNAYIVAIKSVHDAFEELREWISIHDAVLEPSAGPVYATADDFITSLSVS